ncbi:period circadian protein homolog 1b isoform 2-T2 [Spinachia spinachia]
MSYDDSTSMPSGCSRGRGARADEESPDHGEESDGFNSPTSGPASADVARERERAANSDDMDGLSSGNDSGERESEGGMDRDGGSHGRSSHSSSNGKDSGMMLEATESNKSSNSQSLSPPSSSLAYSLLSTSSERDPPSTSGCSSNQSARVQTQKDLMKAIKELKLRLPSERKAKGHTSTLNALKYALQCVKQVRANKEYYHQWSVEECQGCSLDLSAFTIEELDNITSEYTLKNTDTFSMGVSFLSGKVVYVSPHGSSLLRCKPERLQGTMFSELLAPQDVSTFYSGTAPCRLPNWASCIGFASPPVDCTQEKSMFCRIGADQVQAGEMRYYPFRLTPYQLTIRDSDEAEPQPCCLLIAERVHSGYEAPRIPPEKRIFTTSHTPSCLFQEVDERAVPLLGYLPQDLVGTPTLLYIHPEDRPLMVAIHEKIFQFAGQPFDHTPLRICARNGEYLTIDTSWSSFVNPWSRKVAFIVGRHKVRTSPLNEDVFTTAQCCETRATTPDVVRLSERIHRLLAQPVHSGSSRGYSSLGSSGSRASRRSHQQRLCTSGASSSDSSGGADADKVAAAAVVVSQKPMTFQQICKDVHMVKTNGQQVFIESRNRPLPRKNTSPGTTGMRAISSDPIRSLIADMTKPPKPLVPAPLVPQEPPTGYSYQQINCLDSIVRYLDSCNIPNTVKRKCGSSTSDEDKQLETGNNTDINMEEAPPTTTPTPPAATLLAIKAIAFPSLPPQAAQPEKDGRGSVVGGGGGGGGGRMGLTKEVLSAHTQQEEQAFLDRFKDLSKLRVFDQAASLALHGQTPAANPLSRGARCSRDYPAAGSSTSHRRGGKRLKHQESSDRQSSMCLDARAGAAPVPSDLPIGPPTNSSPWPSVGSQAGVPAAPFAPGMLPLYPVYPPLAQPLSVPDASPFPPTQMVPSMVALVLPNYMFPQMGVPISQPAPVPVPFFNPNFTYPAATHAAISGIVSNSVPIQATCAPSRSSTPQSYSQTPAACEGAESPLFQSRCSSPLNLLQLEETPSNRLEVTTALVATQQDPPSLQGAAAGVHSSKENGEANESNNDAMSTSSDLLDMLLQEDARSGTGSAASGSGSSGSGSGSNGCSSFGTSGMSSSQGSHTSKYFGSIDSSENDHSRKQPAGGSSSAGGDGGEEQFIKCVLQDPIWLLMANTDDKVMMTYQLPVRDMETVLREDREALRSMQKHQPRFSEDQKRELSQVHPWIRTGRLPRAINVSSCAGCKSPPCAAATAPFDVEIHEMELGGALKEREGETNRSEAPMDGAHPQDGEDGEGAQGGNQEVAAEEQAASEDAKEKSDMIH